MIAFISSGAIQLLVGPASFSSHRADVRAVLDPGDVGGVGGAVERVRLLGRVELHVGAGGDQRLGETGPLLVRAVAPVHRVGRVSSATCSTQAVQAGVPRGRGAGDRTLARRAQARGAGRRVGAHQGQSLSRFAGAGAVRRCPTLAARRRTCRVAFIVKARAPCHDGSPVSHAGIPVGWVRAREVPHKAQRTDVRLREPVGFLRIRLLVGDQDGRRAHRHRLRRGRHRAVLVDEVLPREGDAGRGPGDHASPGGGLGALACRCRRRGSRRRARRGRSPGCRCR